MADFAEIVAENVVREFGTGRHKFTAVDSLSLTFGTDSAIGVVGESGSGKSTLARLLCGLDKPTSGSVTLNGREVTSYLQIRNDRSEFRRTVQYIAQDTTSSFDPRRTLRDAVTTPARRLRDLGKGPADEKAEELVTLLGLDPSLLDRYPAQVSGGQRQRFSLARGLVVEPKLLICDEVVSALDVSVQGSILNTLKAYCKEHDAGLMFVSHGLPATAFIADELMVMYKGSVVEQGSTEDVLTKSTQPYTLSLLEAYGDDLQPTG
jgi:ABC-type dipeptide/oligopeptide/nickel transport system ATPase subunit